jgi:hypothetical protein
MDIVQRNFAGGEIAPGLYGRPDTTKYQTGARTMRNMFVRRHGGASNRTGGEFICEQANSSARGRLIKFVFNAEQTYVLLFEHQRVRVVQNGVLLTVSGVLAWSAATNYVAGDLASRLGVNYYCIAAHVNQQPPNATWWYPMPADGTYEVPSPFTSSNLQSVYRSQSADVVTLTTTSERIFDLSRTGHTTWVFTIANMAPSIAAPPTLTNSGAGGTVTQWVATAVKVETYEESLPSSSTGTSATPSSGSPITLTIGAVSGALEYNVYKNEGNGIYGFIGVSSGPTFIDRGHVPDYDLTPPAARDPFATSGNYPACSGYLQQRKSYGGSINNPETVYGSKTGQYKNFGISSPLRLNDAITYPIASREVNEIRHMLEVLETFILTAGVEWVALGGTDGALTPGSPGLKPKSFYGSSPVPPVIIGDNILFIQALGSLVRDLNYDATAKGYSGRDLSVFAPHLFIGKTIEHWDYAQTPDSIVLAQQNDGSMIGMTYLPEHEVWGWFHYDTDGTYEDVVSVPEGGEHATYYLVNRTINGVTKRYLERFASRTITDIEVDAIFLDSYLTYDGRLSGDGMTLSGGTDWLHTEDLTMTYAGPSFFVPGDVGNSIRLELYATTYTPEDGHVSTHEYLVCVIAAYISATQVTVNAEKTVPAAFRNVEIQEFARGADEISGLDHLEGKAVGIFADGNVIANGIDAPLTVVTGGAITLEQPHFVIHVGLPYVSDLETLDLELDGGETLASKKKLVNNVTVHVEAARGLWVGEDKDHLSEWRQRTATLNYGLPIPLFTGKIEVAIRSTWNTGGRVFLRQRDPLPLTVLNVIPNVSVGG